jgi:hypothetical protein
MSDARWLDVEANVAEASEHFANARASLAIGRFDASSLESYRDSMALTHPMPSAHPISTRRGDFAIARNAPTATSTLPGRRRPSKRPGVSRRRSR